jgi:glucokinase
MPEASTEFLGIEIGGTKLQIVRGSGRRIAGEPWKADANRQGGGPAICRQILDGIRALQAQGARPTAIAVGFGGPVNHVTGQIVRSHQIAGWENFALRDWLSKETGLPVVIENDSNLAAYAEALTGAGESFDPVFYFNLGSGVGGGLVVGRQIYHGQPPGEAEFGHLRLDRSGTIVESLCSGWAIDSQIRNLAKTHPASTLARSLPPGAGGESKLLPTALAQNDPAALKIFNDLTDNLAFALSHVIHLLHPGCIVLGGGLSHLGEPLRVSISDKLSTYVMEAFRPAPPLKLAKHGENAVPIGALLLASTLQQRSIQ